jgi:hypothetical protein
MCAEGADDSDLEDGHTGDEQIMRERASRSGASQVTVRRR